MGKSTLIIVLGYIMIFGMIQGDMYKITERAVENVSEIYENTQLRQLTNSALEYIVSLNVQTGTTDTTISDSNWLGGSFTGSMSLQGTDDTIDTVTVEVTGEFPDQSYYTATAQFQSQCPSTSLPFPTITASLGFYSPTAALTMKAWGEINGNDKNMDGSAGDSTALPGVSTSGTLSISMKGQSTIIGAPPSPNPATVSGTWQDLQSLADAYAPNADYTVPAGSTIPGANYGSIDNPVIVHCLGDVQYTSWTVGYGILIVRGNLRCTSHFKWYGLILIVNPVSNSFTDNAHSNIYGALLMGAPNSTADIKAQSGLQYSSEALDIVLNNLTSGGGSTTVAGPRQITQIDWWE